MRSIGGYFGFELIEKSSGYHSTAIKLNTGRNALEYILMANNYTKLYIPFFTCEAILAPISKLNIDYEYYSIDKYLEPIFNYDILKENEGFLYTNYFGLKNEFILNLTKVSSNILIDNAQSFFSKPIPGIDTFYSARKFFGVSDGAYLYTGKKLATVFDIDDSTSRITHLVKRIEYGAEKGYIDFLKIEEELKNQPILQMSKLTDKIMKSIDYTFVKNTRLKNLNYLMKELNSFNELNFNMVVDTVPMIYPFLRVNNFKIYDVLIKNKIFAPKYWPNVKDLVSNNSFEYYLSENILALPIDHRYNLGDMEYIVGLIKNELK